MPSLAKHLGGLRRGGGGEEKCLGESRSQSMKWVRAPKENLSGGGAGFSGAVLGLCRVRAPPAASSPSGGRLQRV